MARIVLIDGNAILHRAYHALPPLTAPDGSIVNAVYGFTTMLFRIMQDLKPTHLAVAFDRAAPTFRKELFKEYQATRPKLEDDLASQIPKVHDLISAFGIKIFELDGFEADDIVGTLAKKATSDPSASLGAGKEEAISSAIDQVIIVTGDKDLLQLVDEKTYVYMPVKGLSESKLYDEAAVKEKLGVTPKQIPDYKALAGDASDNYPGVGGIGPKTAADLLLHHGSVEALYKETGRRQDSKISDRVKEKLLKGKESAILSKQLATIRTDVPIAVAIDNLRVETLDTPESRKALEGFHFPSLVKRLEKLGKKEEPKPAKRLRKKTQAEKNEEQLSLI